MITKYITLLTFIPWIIYFSISILKHLDNYYYKKFNFKYLKKNFFKIFRLDLLFLIGVFFYFAKFQKDFVDKYLFAVINIYLCVNSFYDNNKLNRRVIKENIFKIVLILVIMIIPFLIYFKEDNLGFLYKVLLVYLFLEYIIILGVSYIERIIFVHKKRIEIRLAYKEELDKIMDLVIRVFEGEQDIPGKLNYIEKNLEPRWWVATYKENIVGTIALWKENNKYHLGRLVVDKKYRGYNIATMLIDKGLETIFQEGIEIIYMEARDITVDIMLKYGAKIEGDKKPFYKGMVTPLTLRKRDYKKKN